MKWVRRWDSLTVYRLGEGDSDSDGLGGGDSDSNLGCKVGIVTVTWAGRWDSLTVI